MDVFQRRISLEEAASMLQTALGSELLSGANSAIFHDLALMRSRIAALQAAFPKSTLHTVAIKANPVLEILRELVTTDIGLEAASMEEVELARAAGCRTERIVFDSPAKTVEEIRQALEWGVYLNVDNFDELARVAAARTKIASSSGVGLRVNPQVGGGAIAETSVAHEKSKFGVPLAENRARILAAFREHDWLVGLHVHVGSQGCSLQLLADGVRRIEELRREIVAETGRNVSRVDIGGGLPTSYRDGGSAPTPAAYCEMLKATSPELFAADISLITEFGRAIQANCGLAVSRVEYVKPAQHLAVIHLGADLLLRTVYRPEAWPHEYFVLDPSGRVKSGPTRPLTIAGPLCFSGDILARDVELPTMEPGDWLVIRDVGAYTLSMWSRHCSRGIPAVLGYDSAKPEPWRLLRARETSADLVDFWRRDRRK